MRQQQLEGLVLAAIDRARAGNPTEDDRIEFKREWPDVGKVRQLAGAVNRANGSYVVYIVGTDERGVIFPLGSTDVADWWAQFSSKFDGVPPDLVNHINVPIDGANSVTALEFGTERAPYVVKVDKGGSPEREVPIREGTRTRSATRTELLRMLRPQASVPPALPLTGMVKADFYTDDEGGGDRCVIFGTATVFLEHTSPSAIMLPSHDIAVTIEADGRVFPLPGQLVPSKAGQVPPAFGVHVQRDGVFATGPGSFVIRFEQQFDQSERTFLLAVQSWEMRLRFGVTGAQRATQVEVRLSRSPEPEGDPDDYEYRSSVPIGQWHLRAGLVSSSSDLSNVVPLPRVRR
jgi:hypothetical protein